MKPATPQSGALPRAVAASATIGNDHAARHMFVGRFASRYVSVRAISRNLIPLAIFALVIPTSAMAQVEFTATVPVAPDQISLYKLAPSAAANDFVNEKLTAVRLPQLKLEANMLMSRGATGEIDKDKVRAFADPATGDVHFIPNLRDLTAETNLNKTVEPSAALAIAKKAFADARFIPKDVTELRVSDPIPVMGSSIARGAPKNDGASKPRLVMNLIPAYRYAGGLPVYGIGSHALVSIANDLSITGVLRRWRTATAGDKIKPTMTAERAKADILRQLTPYAKGGTHANVDKIILAYYDGNANYLQPVYRFEALLTPAKKSISPIKIAGYVPLGKALEPIPDLVAAPTGPTPSTSSVPPKAAAQPQLKTVALTAMATPGGIGGPPMISVGEFANQDWPTSSAYLEMANNFLVGLENGNKFSPAAPPISRTIWWSAYSWQVNGPQSKDWMNAVNVAYTEPHGDWLSNSTLSDNADVWSIQNIGTGGNPGFGAAAGGVLATWVIMSCEVVPSYYDRANEAGGTDVGSTAFDAWWPVFQGLHNVLGFRTIMHYPNDALQYAFGFDAALGGDVNAAWFDEVAVHAGNYGTYPSQHLMGSPQVTYDRASTMIDGRDLGQSIYSVGGQTASTQLWNFWMSN